MRQTNVPSVLMVLNFNNWKKSIMKISIVVAVYNNEGAISKTCENIHSIFLSELAEHEYEIICVDDGSKDGSLPELLSLRKKDSRVKVITFTRNFGQREAMLAGFEEAAGDAIINISADLQDPVELIPQMVDKWLGGAETVICYRANREDRLAVKILSSIAYRLLRISLPQIPTGGFDYVLMDRKVLDTFNSMDVKHRFFQGKLLWMGYTTSLIPYTRLKRTIGKSQYTFGKKLKFLIDALFDLSYFPIRFISLIGVIISMLGVLYSINIVFSWWQGKTPFSGWPPIMMLILLMGGMIMVMLGVIGEYVWRIYEEGRKRPNYIIRESFLS